MMIRLRMWCKDKAMVDRAIAIRDIIELLQMVGKVVAMRLGGNVIPDDVMTFQLATICTVVDKMIK